MDSLRTQHMYLVHRFKGGEVIDLCWVFSPTPICEFRKDRVREPFGRVQCNFSRLPVEILKQNGLELELQHPLDPDLGIETVSASKVYFHFRLTPSSMRDADQVCVRVISSYKPLLPGFCPIDISTLLLNHRNWEGELLLEKDISILDDIELAKRRIRFKAGGFKGYIHPQDLLREAQSLKGELCVA